MRLLCSLICLAGLPLAGLLFADGPRDNQPENVRSIPPKGIAISDEDRERLQKGLDEVGKEVASLRKTLKASLRDLLPDVEVLHKAVRYALELNEFYGPNQVKIAHELLEQARGRAADLRAGTAPWTTARGGLMVRGYRSKIDGSVQPYGLLVPNSYRPTSTNRHRLDIWCHGRGETLSELAFINDRQHNLGEFAPRDALVLHPYGRFCNANKFAGEIDVLEAIRHVREHYHIDDDRIVMRGFSMGGASCWQFAVHYPDHWVAAAPGAGFSETPEFLRIFQGEKLTPTDYEKKLWRLYDCPGYAANLFNLPVVAYSGSKDTQKQAADEMAKALAALDMPLVHLIGPGAGHGYHPVTKSELNRRIDRLAAQGRPRVPPEVHFHTFTLRYNRSYWVRIDGLEKHWEAAKVEAAMIPPKSGPHMRIAVKTGNVSAFSLLFDAGDWPLSDRSRPELQIDATNDLVGPPIASDRSWTAHFRKEAGKWQLVKSADDGTLRKRHGLQGPIDDAFLDSFLMVRPTGKPLNDRVGVWATGEMDHAITHWRKHFRGDARVKEDSAVTAADIAADNLVLWGDPSSNALLAKVLPMLPVRWDSKTVSLGKGSYAAADHVPVLIYPNPLNPRRYVVLNSGFTFREYDYLNNARQVPKLPDFAILDVRTPPSSRWAGKVVSAGFFNETWGVDEK